MQDCFERTGCITQGSHHAGVGPKATLSRGGSTCLRPSRRRAVKQRPQITIISCVASKVDFCSTCSMTLTTLKKLNSRPLLGIEFEEQAPMHNPLMTLLSTPNKWNSWASLGAACEKRASQYNALMTLLTIPNDLNLWPLLGI